MKPDLYTKVVLTVIAIMLSVIACNWYVNPNATAQAQGSRFAGVQFAENQYEQSFFDTRTGDLWTYSNEGGSTRTWTHVGTIAKLGEPLK